MPRPSLVPGGIRAKKGRITAAPTSSPVRRAAGDSTWSRTRHRPRDMQDNAHEAVRQPSAPTARSCGATCGPSQARDRTSRSTGAASLAECARIPEGISASAPCRVKPTRLPVMSGPGMRPEGRSPWREGGRRVGGADDPDRGTRLPGAPGAPASGAGDRPPPAPAGQPGHRGRAESVFHRMLSGSVALLTVIGRRTGASHQLAAPPGRACRTDVQGLGARRRDTWRSALAVHSNEDVGDVGIGQGPIGG